MVQTTIYKIVCKYPLVTDCYVGMSKDVTLRFTQHQLACYNENCKNYNYKIYKTIRSNGGFDNWILQEIETIEHDDNDNSIARERESYWFHELNSTLNNNVPNQSSKLSKQIWKTNNPDYYREYSKQYILKNKDMLIEKHKNYYLENKAHINAQSSQWVKDNRDHNRAYQRERCRKIAAAKKAQAALSQIE